MNLDTLYYIRDYSGNYYKVDNNDQLVVTDSEKKCDDIYICAGEQKTFGRKENGFLLHGTNTGGSG